MDVKLKLNPTSVILSTRGLGDNGSVQKFIDSEVLRLCDPLIPMRSGALKRSGTSATIIGSGEVKYSTPYARQQYYENRGNGQRGRLWFERMKADHKEQILQGAKRMAGAK